MRLLSRLIGAPVAAGALALAAASPLLGAAPVAAATGPDIGISVVAVGTPVEGGSALFVATITNNGPDVWNNVTSTGGINVPLNGVSSGTGTCATGRNSVWTCVWGSLAPGASVSYLVSGKVGSATSVTVNTTVQGFDTDSTNNRSSATVAVVGAPPDVQLNGTVLNKQPAPGARVDLRYDVKLGGKSPAPDVVLTATLPAGVSAIPELLSPLCTVAGQVVTCTLGSIASGGISGVDISVQAPATLGATAAVTATALASNGDNNLSNNTEDLSFTTR